MNKKKILIIENSTHITGALKSITRTAFDLSAYFDFSFIIPKNSQGKSWIVNRGFSNVKELAMHELSRSIWSAIRYLPYLLVNGSKLNRHVRRNQIDVIHVNDVYNLLPVAIRMFGNKTPYVCHVRFMPDRFPRFLVTFWMNLHIRFAASIVAVSDSVKKQLPSHPKIVVIHNELPIEERHPRRSVKNETHHFLYLSNFIPGKGQNFALEAFSKIHDQIPGWKLRFGGGDMNLEKNRRYLHNLKERGKELGLAQKVEWCDFIDDVEIEYKSADVVLNFSESESFSITCLEALFYGSPTIVSDCGGPAEIVDNMITGVLVPNRKVEAMAEAMLQLATDEKLRLTLGTAARETVRNRFSVQNTSYRLREVYLAALIQS